MVFVFKLGNSFPRQHFSIRLYTLELYGYGSYPLARLRGPPDEGLAFLLLLPPPLLLGRPTLPLEALFDLAAVTSDASRPLADFFGLEARNTADRSPPLIVPESNTHTYITISTDFLSSPPYIHSLNYL